MSEKLRHRIQRAKRINALMTGVFTGIGGFFLGLIIVLAGYIIIHGLMSYYPGLLSFTSKGIGNQLFNTVYLVFWALLISVPLGVLAGIYMAEYAGDTKLTRFIRVCIESLSSLPSIVIGLFGYLVFILMTGARWNLFAGADRRQMEPVCRRARGFDSESSVCHNDNRGCDAFPAEEL